MDFHPAQNKRPDQFFQSTGGFLILIPFDGNGKRILKMIKDEPAEKLLERKYRVIQDRLFESDFDREIKRLEGKK